MSHEGPCVIPRLFISVLCYHDTLTEALIVPRQSETYELFEKDPVKYVGTSGTQQYGA